MSLAQKTDRQRVGFETTGLFDRLRRSGDAGSRPEFRFLLLLLSLTLFSGMAVAQSRVALIIGNARYVHAPILANPVNDARALEASLTRLGFRVFVGTDIKRKGDMEAMIRQFSREVAGADVGLFFYAGHGLQVAGQNYLVPTEAEIREERDIAFEALDLDLIVKVLDQGPRVNLVFLDACRDNPFVANLARSMRTRSNLVSRGLAQMQAASGTLVAYSTQPGNVAADGDSRNSPFVRALLDYIETPGLEIRQILTRVRNSVMQQTQNRQTPWDHSSLTTDFYFVGAAGSQPRNDGGTAAPPADLRELAFWESVKDSNDRAQLQAFLDTYPQSPFAVLAKRRIEQLAASTNMPTAAPAPAATPSMQEAALGMTVERRAAVQRALNALGYPVGAADGTFGPATREAIARWQTRSGAPASGYLDQAQLSALLAAGEQALFEQRALMASRVGGRWAGRFYGSTGSAGTVEFTMDLEVSGNQFTGRTSEPNTFGHPSARFLYGNIRGDVSGRTIRYIKTYDGTGGQSHSVEYSGTFNESWTAVSGRWRIGTVADRFELWRR